jgi:2-amino-4-hydroxy-6-hydroxymethyldihydropteridine diphosphokinase
LRGTRPASPSRVLPDVARCLIGLGSNQGDRLALIAEALAALGRLPATRLVRCSRVLETPPEAPGDGGPYLNAAALLDTGRGPIALLVDLLAVERRLGRRRGASGGVSRGSASARPPAAADRSRRIDLDLILYQGAPTIRASARGQVASVSRLEHPHPRFRRRSFVLLPAAQVAPWMRDPHTGRTMSELAALAS